MLLKLLAKRLALAMLLFAAPFVMNAQQKTVSGKITNNADGSPVSGASVVAKGAKTGTQTAADGTFSLSVANTVTKLIITSIGFASQEVTIGNGPLEITLTATTEGLSEVVVIGYGTVRKKDVTGSVTSIKAKDFNQGVITAPDQLIQGKAAGVQVINNTGAPGGSTTLRIRGISSLRGGNSPLIVVDGVPLPSGSAAPSVTSDLGGSHGNDNPLNFINPADIATIDVLKDASATAIYGSRGANGVIQITTKKGTSGQPKIEFSSSVGVSKMRNTLDVLNAAEYVAALGKYNLATAVSTTTAKTANGGSSVDAMKAIMRTAITNNQNMAISGGTENGRYRLSIGYLDQQGIIKGSGFKKLNASLNTSFRFLESKKLGLDFNIIATNTVTDNAPIGSRSGYQGSLIGAALSWNPTFSLTNPDGTPIVVHPLLSDVKVVNPLALLDATNDESRLTSILASIAPSYKITKDLEYKFLYSINYGLGNRASEIRNWINIDNLNTVGWASVVNNKNVTQSLAHTLNYNTSVGKSVNIGALVGYEYNRFDNSGSGINGKGFVDYPGLKYTDYIQNLPTANRNVYGYADAIGHLQSVFGRANVNYKDKYILTATMRADGSSRFGKNNKYGYFPAVALGWNIANENFLKGMKTISALKLRLGWGKTGNQEFPDNATSLRRVGIGIGSTQTVNSLENNDLKWEESTTINAGIDFGILDNRVTGSIDYFNKKSKDILYNLPVTQPGPATSFWTNLPMTIENSGVEITLNSNIIRKADFNVNLGFNIAFLKNQISGLPYVPETGELNGSGLSNVYSQRLVNGYPVNVFYVANWQGLDANGFSKYEGGSSTNKFYQGSPNPKMLVGFTTEATYKRLGFVANFNGAFGHYLYNNSKLSVAITNLGLRNVASTYLDGPKEDRANASAASNRDLEKGNYIKLANATLSYKVGNVAKVFKGLSVYVTGQNLFVITKYTGFDPEVNVDKSRDGIPSQGIEYNQYPSARTFILGVNFGL